MSLKKVDESKKALARKIGKLPKAPKKPKKSATLTAMENYVSRYNAYVDKINDMANRANKLRTMKKSIFGSEWAEKKTFTNHLPIYLDQ